MEKFVFEKMFAHRSVICFMLVMMLMLTNIFRVAVIANSGYKTVQNEQSSYRIKLSKLRGTIYDRNMIPFTNNTLKVVAAVSPTPKGIIAISSLLDGDQLQNALASLREEKVAICTLDDVIEREGIVCTTVYEHTSENLQACHIIGYTDSTGHGVSGIEKAYDELLYSEKSVSAVYTVDGSGDILSGISPYFENDLSVINSGVVTTLDINIQNIVENVCENFECGAVVVAEATSGKIRAMLSKPSFNINDIAGSLDDENSPLINRALYCYNVGSVFKPCVAVTACEMGAGSLEYTCTGSTEIVDRVFKCHRLDGHQTVNLRNALAQSCNCYFYNLGILTGADALYKTAAALNFGSRIEIAKNIYTLSPTLTKPSSLTNNAQIANFSIGQGELLLSPVSMLTLYCAIATNGSYYLPSIIEKTIVDGRSEEYNYGYPTRVMSEETAERMRDYLQSVVSEGTGVEAATLLCSCAGKTATAQTGRYYEDGNEITNSWFCGFFPAEQPKYVVIVMSDGNSSITTTSIFSQIADAITEYELKNK